MKQDCNISEQQHPFFSLWPEDTGAPELCTVSKIMASPKAGVGRHEQTGGGSNNDVHRLAQAKAVCLLGNRFAMVGSSSKGVSLA